MAAGRLFHIAGALVFGLALVAFAAAVALPSLPGRMNYDSLDIYAQALSGRIHDWHPPLIAWTWRQLGPSPALLAAQTLLSTGVVVLSIAAILRAAGASRILALASTVAVVLSPPVLAHLVAVSKDTWVAALLLATMALALQPSRAVPAARAARLACLVLAAYNRPELLLFVPLFALAEALIAKPGRRLAAGALAVAVLVAGAAALRTAEQRLVQPQRLAPAQIIFVFDLAGMSLSRGEMLLPPASFPPQDLDVLRRHHTPLNVIPFVWGEPADEMVRLLPADQVAPLRAAWLGAILRMPLTYLEVRAPLAAAYLRGHWGFHPGIDDNALGLALFFPAANEAVNGYLRTLPTWSYSHALAILAALALAPFALRLFGVAGPPLALFLLFAALYQLSFLVTAAAPDYRYGYAGAVIAYVGAAALLVRSWRARVGT